MTYNEIKAEIVAAPKTYLPGLLVAVVKTLIDKKVLKPGGAARIAQNVEDEADGVPDASKTPDESTLASATGSASRPLTLTMEEIRHLALFCGMVIAEPTPKEKEDERETEIVIAPWPKMGVKGDDGMLSPHKHIAYYAEYPEEGCVPLGTPNAKLRDAGESGVEQH